MNLYYFLEKIIEENSIEEVIIEEGLYRNIEEKPIGKFFSLAHHEINRLLDHLNTKLRKNINTTMHQKVESL